MKKLILATAVGISLSGCDTLSSINNKDLRFAQTYAEQRAGFTYVPIEPMGVIPVCQDCPEGAPLTKNILLNGLPDNSVRIATRKISGSAKGGIGAIGLNTGIEGNTYEVIIDYVTTETINMRFYGYWQSFQTDRDGEIVERGESRRSFYDRPYNTKARGNGFGTSWKLIVTGVEGDTIDEVLSITEYTVDREKDAFNIPVYVGLGLRLKANVTVLKGTVDFTGLGAITSAVEAGNASGSMSVQTIGVTGPAPRMNLKIINEISENTVIDQIQTLASVKAAIEGADTIVSPRIVGFHNTPGTDSQGINNIHSLLAQRKLYLDIYTAQSAGGTTEE